MVVGGPFAHSGPERADFVPGMIAVILSHPASGVGQQRGFPDRAERRLGRYGPVWKHTEKEVFDHCGRVYNEDLVRAQGYRAATRRIP